MEKGKKKFKREEVENLISKIRSDYEEKITSFKLRINELHSEVDLLKAELVAYKENDDKISSAIKDAEDFSVSLKNKAIQRYNAEIESLKSFATRWRAYFEGLKEKYPLYGKIDSARKTFDGILESINSFDGKDAIVKSQEVFDDMAGEFVFNPKGKIDEFVASTSDNGFNLDEVLNPGDLELEELCKELGLLDESL